MKSFGTPTFAWDGVLSELTSASVLPSESTVIDPLTGLPLSAISADPVEILASALSNNVLFNDFMTGAVRSLDLEVTGPGASFPVVTPSKTVGAIVRWTLELADDGRPFERYAVEYQTPLP